jgi:hypothetical protein
VGRDTREVTAVAAVSPDPILAPAPPMFIRRGCPSHAADTTWMWHPRRMDLDEGQVSRSGGRVWFAPEAFICRVCRLWLDSAAELVTAHTGEWLEIEGADPYDYEPPIPDEDSFTRHGGNRGRNAIRDIDRIGGSDRQGCRTTGTKRVSHQQWHRPSPVNAFLRRSSY